MQIKPTHPNLEVPSSERVKEDVLGQNATMGPRGKNCL